MEMKIDKRIRSGKSVVGGVEIRYDIEQETGKTPLRVSASIKKDEERVGSMVIEADGRMYISLDNSSDISHEARKQILITILSDTEFIFNESVVSENQTSE